MVQGTVEVIYMYLDRNGTEREREKNKCREEFSIDRVNNFEVMWVKLID